MKTTHSHPFRRFAMAMACGLAIAPVAMAADSSMAGSHEHGFAAMDTNGDGKISADEHAAGAQRMFDTMDANHDGKVDAAEMTAAHQKMMGGQPAKSELSAAEKIKAIDTNGDGILTADEHAAGSRSMFDRMDTDKDGFLSKAEYEAGHAKMLHKPA